MVAQLFDYTTKHWIVHFKWVTRMVYELYHNKAVTKKRAGSRKPEGKAGLLSRGRGWPRKGLFQANLSSHLSLHYVILCVLFYCCCHFKKKMDMPTFSFPRKTRPGPVCLLKSSEHWWNANGPNYINIPSGWYSPGSLVLFDCDWLDVLFMFHSCWFGSLRVNLLCDLPSSPCPIFPKALI